MIVKTEKRAIISKAIITLDEEECKNFIFILNRATLYNSPDPAKDPVIILARKLSTAIYTDNETKTRRRKAH